MPFLTAAVFVSLLSFFSPNAAASAPDSFQIQAATATVAIKPYGFPNPVSIKTHGSIIFKNLKPSEKVSIFGMGGIFAKEIQANSLGLASWNLKDTQGLAVPIGTYVVVAPESGRRFKILVVP